MRPHSILLLVLPLLAAPQRPASAQTTQPVPPLPLPLPLPPGASTRPIYLPGTPNGGYPIDRAVFVAPPAAGGSDLTGDGTVAKPYATFARGENAVAQLRWQRPTLSNDAVLMLAASVAGAFAQAWPMGTNNDRFVVGAYGQRNAGDRAVIVCAQSGFQLNNRTGVHFVGLEVRALNRAPDDPNWANREGGDGFTMINGCDDVSLDGCVAWHFRNGVDFLGRGGSALRVWNSNLSYNYAFVPPPGPVNKAFGLYAEGAVTDEQRNVIAYNGWCPGRDDWNDPLTRKSYEQNHGTYLNQSYSPGPAVSRGSFYVANAACGLQMRPGGTIAGDVFVTNGVAADCFTDGAAGWIIGNLVLGNREPGPWANAGGSLLGQSVQQVIAGNLFLRANPTPDAPLRLQATNYPPSTVPLTSAAAISGNLGVFPNPTPPVNVTAARLYTTLANNAFVAPLPPPASTPDLLDYSGLPTLAAWVQFTKDHPESVDAPGCIAWATPIVQRLMTPPPVVIPAPAPAPFDVTLSVDPKTQKVTQK